MIVEGCGVSLCHGRMTLGISGLDSLGGGIDPLPVTDRAVSGRLRTNRISTRPERMDSSQNIHRQPARYARTPPRRGPKLGAVVILLCFSFSGLANGAQQTYPKDKAPTNAPRSAGVAMSAITPYATENVPLSGKPQGEPSTCTRRPYQKSQHFAASSGAAKPQKTSELRSQCLHTSTTKV